MAAKPEGFHGYVGVQRRADQAWLWTARWQGREREVDGLVAAGKVRVHESAEDFIAHLDALDERRARSMPARAASTDSA